MTERKKNDASRIPLSQRMRTTTHDVHETSDKLVNLKLAMVLTSKPLYAEAISLFWPIYRELEILMQKHKDHEHLKLLYPLLPQLRRAHLFEKDMISLLGNEKDAKELRSRRMGKIKDAAIFAPSELQSYIDHLRMLSKTDPILLIAYIYAMYGAIMAGGAIIKRMVKTAFSLKDNGGVEIFTVSFEGSSFKNMASFRKDMKRRLDEDMQLSEEEEARILKEAPQVFVRNNALVATVKDSKAFHRVWEKCQRYFVIIPSLAVAAFAILAVVLRQK